MKSIYKTLFVLSTLIIISCSEKEPPQHPNVIVMVLDTTRADHLHSYGYTRDTSPVLDQFAKENTRFEYAVSAAPWTPASIASISTGLYPASHAMMPPNNREEAKENSAKLNPNLDTLPEIFAKYGYKTAAVSPNPWISKEFGYDQGYADFRYQLRARADTITSTAIELVEQSTKTAEPFFLYVHYLDPHDPYDPPGNFAGMYQGATKRKFEYPAKMAKNIGLYDGEIRYMDQEIGRFFDTLKQKKLWEDTVIVIVGDHGEQFLEHGDHRHGFKLYNEELHVPLLLKTGRKRDSGRVVKETVSTVDIFPTLLELAHIQSPPTLPGVSLLSSEKIKGRYGVLSEIRRRYSQRSLTNLAGQKVILEVPLAEDTADLVPSLERWKNPTLVGVFDRTVDEEEREPLGNSALYSELREKFEAELQKAVKLRVSGGNVPAAVSDETLEQLKSLGYLQ